MNRKIIGVLSAVLFLFGGSILPSSSQADSNSKKKAKEAAKAVGKKGFLSKSYYAKLNAGEAVRINKKSKSSSAGASGLGILATGNVPAIPDIPSYPPSSLFWPNGEVATLNSDDSPSQQVCGDFWGGTEEGSSGGMNACFLTESSGRGFEEVLRSGTSVCYMSQFPGAQSGVELVSGEFPGGNPNNIFKPDATADRLVKVNVSGFGEGSETIFIKIYSQANNGSGNQYKHELWFCGGDPNPKDLEVLEIKNNGKYLASNLGGDAGEGSTFQTSLEAFITSSGNGKPSFDTTKSRTLNVSFARGSGDFFKALMEITSSNYIKTKSYDKHGSDDARAGYQVAKFAGTDISSFKILEGGSKDSNGYSGIVEFLNDGYYSSSNSAIQSMLNQVDVESDSFYQTEPSVDSSALLNYSCSATADIELDLDMSDPAMQAIALQCEGSRLEDMDYCRSGDIQEAIDNFFANCMGPG